MSANKQEEPQPDRWYNLTLGPSFNDSSQPPPSKFCTLRFEFKPASIDKTQRGQLHKTKDNKVSVEFNNNQPGKPKVAFEGASEDYKENDAVLFFDGQTFRLERLHRAVKRLRHVRLPGESALAPSAAAAAAAGDAASPTLAPAPAPAPVPGSGLGMGRGLKGQNQSGPVRAGFTPPPQPPPVAVEVERIDIGDAGNSGGMSKNEKSSDTPPVQPDAATTPDSKDFDLEAELNILDDEDDALGPEKSDAGEKDIHTGIDINLPHQNDTDDEIADVDVNDDNGSMGGNAAEALRAQVNAVEGEGQTSSSSASTGSETSGSSSDSGSGSGSSDSDSESSDGDSVNSI